MKRAVPVLTKASKKASAAASDGQSNPGNGLQSLRVAFRILDELASSHVALGVTELAEPLGELKPRVYRHLATLRQLGVVHQEPRTGKYRLGSKLFQLGEAAVDQFDLRHLAAPHLTRLRDLTRQTVLLSVPANGEPLVIACVEYRNRISITSRPGNRPPAHCSSQGRIVLAFSPEEVRSRLLSRKLPAFTHHSIIDAHAIEQRCQSIRRDLYEEAPHEVMLGINALSAPIFRDEGELVGIIGILGTAEEIPSPPPRDLLAKLHQTAGMLSAELNCPMYYERALVKPPRGLG